MRVIFGIVASLRDGGEFVSKALSVQDCEFAYLSCFEQTTPLRRASSSASNAFTPAPIDCKITQKRAYRSEIHYSHSPRCACGETCLGSWSRSSHSRCRRKRAGGKQGGIASFKNFDKTKSEIEERGVGGERKKDMARVGGEREAVGPLEEERRKKNVISFSQFFLFCKKICALSWARSLIRHQEGAVGAS